MLRLLRMISLPHLRAGWGRALIVLSGVATGVALLVAVNTSTTTAIESTRRALEASAGPADLEVTLGLGESGFAESTVEVVRGDPGVAAAVGLLRGWIALADDPADAIQLFGADLSAEADLDRYHVAARSSRRDMLRAAEDPRAVFLTESVAARHGLALGAEAAFTTARGVQRLVVRGLLTDSGVAAALGGRMALMDVGAAQILLARPGEVDQIDVVLKPDADREVVRTRLTGALPTTLHVDVPAARGRQYEAILGSARLLLRTVSALCLVAASYIVLSTTATGAAERANALAALRLIGADGALLARMLLLEAAALSVVGSLVGLVYGLLIAKFLAGMVGVGFGAMFSLRFPDVPLAIDPWEQAAYVVIGVLVGVAASWPAARRVATLEPAIVLRFGGLPPETAPRTGRLLAWAALTIAIGALAIVLEVRLRSAAWGNFGLALWHGSLFLLAIPFVQACAWGWRRLLPRIAGSAGRAAADGIARTPVRTGLAVAAIVLTLSLSMMISTLVHSGARSVVEYFGTMIAGQLAVSGVTTDGGWLETPLEEEVGDLLAAVPGVRAVDTLRVVPGQWYRGERIALTVFSESTLGTDRIQPSWYEEGDPTAAAQATRAGTGVAISTSLATRMDVHVGMPLELDTPSGPFVRPVVGVFRDYMSERGSVIMSRGLYQRFWPDRTVNRFFLALAPNATEADVRAGIAARVQDRYVLRVHSTEQALGYIADIFTNAFAFTDSIQLLIAVVTVAGILDLVFSAIIARRRELALWRLIGADDRAVRAAVVIESVAIGVMGVGLGFFVGVIAAYLWITVNYRYLIGYFFDFHLAWRSVGLSVALVMVMTLIAGWLAARYATRQPVLNGIRSD
ncbi:MAG: FtsX-like permease family protein [Candidatus Binatia bacterium]